MCLRARTRAFVRIHEVDGFLANIFTLCEHEDFLVIYFAMQLHFMLHERYLNCVKTVKHKCFSQSNMGGIQTSNLQVQNPVLRRATEVGYLHVTYHKIKKIIAMARPASLLQVATR
uniref:Uncharacterized protein n=1 Tax=Cacopsylla melanoneura TaxID=428564 RepID=A0A8D8YJU4_9HEMI